MKKAVLIAALLLSILFVNAQTTYYWVGSSTATPNISTLSNWNTAQNGTGSSRASATGTSDILIFDGANLGGATPVTGPVTVNANTSISCAQIKFTGNATINMVRPTSGTSTITIAGEAGDDWVIEAGSTFTVPASTSGSIRFAMAAANSGTVSGVMNTLSSQQFRIDNTTSGTGKLIFTSGSELHTNITGSSAYAFGSSSQSAEKWVVFEAGSKLFYEGGNSPHGSGGGFSAIDMRPGSTWHHRATNTVSSAGNFFNRKSYGDIIVENNATLLQTGSVFQIENLTVSAGCTFTMNTSGQTAVMGNILVDGTITNDPSSTNELILAGSTPQSITGSGTISLATLIVAANADVTMGKDIEVDNAVNVYGKLNFGNFRLTGNATFKATGITSPAAGTGNLTAGSYMIRGNSGVSPATRGLMISGTGIAPNTSVISVSTTGDTIYISNPIAATGTGVTLTVESNGATLATANTNGFDPVSGSAGVLGAHTFNDDVNYIINAATAWPFGVTTSSSATPINARFIEVNAPVTINRAFTVSDHLTVNGKISLRPLDIITILGGAVINGTFNASNYIATTSNAPTAELSVLHYNGAAAAVTLPVGTATHYLPITLTPTSTSSFSVTVFEGITDNGAINGTPFTPSERQNVVNAVWNLDRTSGSGDCAIQLGWPVALEGSTFATLPNTDIGTITNNGTTWSLPIGTADNSSNTSNATISSFGPLSVGAVPQTQPFIFNALPVKTYGDPDFNGGATSLNTTQPIIYSSSNPAVATIVAGDIHIVGAGTTTINASQASDGFYPAASVDQVLTVNKADLTITADNKIKFEGQANPALTATYTGFVLGETPSALLTQATLSTTAVLASPPGTYPITASGATSDNYNISFVDGILTVQPKQNQTITFPAFATKTYGNADFAIGASSTNNTIPITYVSSNTNVATIVGNNIHIVGAGTANITASQAGNAGYFPAPDVTRTLTVNKANLTIRVRDTLKTQGQPNPPFMITYTGFVLGETSANLLTPVVASTTAIDISSPGYYPITLDGATSNNYNITYVNARLTVLPFTGTSAQHLNAYMSSPNTLTVRVYSHIPALGNIVVYDMRGIPLLKRNLFMPVGFISMDIPVGQLPSGIYTVTIKGNDVDLKKTIPVIR